MARKLRWNAPPAKVKAALNVITLESAKLTIIKTKKVDFKRSENMCPSLHSPRKDKN
jgi:hypothetical protein